MVWCHEIMKAFQKFIAGKFTCFLLLLLRILVRIGFAVSVLVDLLVRHRIAVHRLLVTTGGTAVGSGGVEVLGWVGILELLEVRWVLGFDWNKRQILVLIGILGYVLGYLGWSRCILRLGHKWYILRNRLKLIKLRSRNDLIKAGSLAFAGGGGGLRIGFDGIPHHHDVVAAVDGGSYEAVELAQLGDLACLLHLVAFEDVGHQG